MKKIRFLSVICFVLLSSIIGYSQNVDSLDFQLKYDSTTCWYDFNIIILGGYAEGVGQRTQFNSQITLIVPTGSTVDIAEKYMPLEANQWYTGTIPMNWSFGTSVIDPDALPGFDFISILPSLSPASQYNNIYTGDTIKLFSLEINNTQDCGIGIRLYENGVDPTSTDPGMNGADFSNGFTIGGITQLYQNNAPSIFPLAPQILEITDNSGENIDIQIETGGAECQGAVEYMWTGPNAYTSTTQNVFISPAMPENFGTYEVIVKDTIGCADTTSIVVEEGSEPPVNNLTWNGLILNSTFEHISAHFNFAGDDNHNSTMVFEYRLTGTTDYKSSAQCMRAFPEMIVDGGALNENFHACSAMFLQPNSEYDLRFTINDPDGGDSIVTTTYFTKEIPVTPSNGNIVYVIPGNGGGDGSLANPYLGIQDAVDNASPGDVIEVADGIYDPFTILNSGMENTPIVVRSTNLHGAIIDGSNTASGIITVGSAADSIRYIRIDGFEIRNGSWGIDAQNTQYLTIENNYVNDVDFGFYNRRENGWEHDQYLNNNKFEGRTAWPQINGEIPGERGIDIRGNRNVISYNTISDFGDGISTDGVPYKVSYALDIHHNFITRIVDDLIEVDGSLSNVRVYRNKCYNGRMGVSLAPVFGGPAYVFRNEFYNLESSTFKMNRSPAGLYIVNNTSIKEDRGMTSDSGWMNTVFKNNAVVSEHYCFEEFGLVANSIDDWDFNGYKSLRAGNASEPWFKWDNTQYHNVADLAGSGLLAMNSISIDLPDFLMASVPTDFSVEALPINTDLEPSVGSALIDNGELLDNILDVFISDGMPDIGAYEKGEAMPEFGHDFEAVCERIDLSLRTWNGNINNAWYHPDNWTPCGVPTTITDVIIPAGANHYPFVNTNIEINNLSILDGGNLEVKGENATIRLLGE